MMKRLYWPVEQSWRNYRGKEGAEGRTPDRSYVKTVWDIGVGWIGGLCRDTGEPRAELRKDSAKGIAYLHSKKGEHPWRAAVEKGLQGELQSRVPREDSEGGSDWGLGEVIPQ